MDIRRQVKDNSAGAVWIDGTDTNRHKERSSRMGIRIQARGARERAGYIYGAVVVEIRLL